MKKLLAVISLFSLTLLPIVPVIACDTANGERICLDNPLENNVTDVRVLIGNVIKGILGVIGSLALLVMIYGGFQWLTSAGNTDKIEAGKKTMVWSVVGVIVALSAFVLVDTLTRYLSTGKF